MGDADLRDRPGAIFSPRAITALDRLYRQYAPWLAARLRRRYGDSAEDIVQETYVRVAGRAETGTIDHPKALLLHIASNVAISAGVSRSRREAREVHFGLLDARPATDGGQEEALLLKQLVRSMPPKLYQVFLLSRFGGLSYERFEAGEGRFDFARVRRFAEIVGVEPFAILFSVLIGSPRFAVRAGYNMLSPLMLLALEEFDADAGDGIASLDGATILRVFGEAFATLREEISRRPGALDGPETPSPYGDEDDG